MFSCFFTVFLAFSGFPEEICCAELASPAVAPVAWTEILAMKELATSTQHISLGKPEKAAKINRKTRKHYKTQGFSVFLRFFLIPKSRKNRKKTQKPYVLQCFLVFYGFFSFFGFP